MCRFSIIVPCYKVANIAHDICQMFETNDYDDYEVIFVDDCSSDGTYKALFSEKKEHDKYKVYQTSENGGPGPARNFGLEKASGEYVIFSDSDDWFDVSCLKRIATFLDVHNDAELLVSPHKVKRGGKTYKDDTYNKYKDEDEVKIDDIVTGNKGPWCKVFKREIILNNSIVFPARMTGEDAIFIVTYAAVIKKAYKLDLLYYTYVMNDASITHRHKADINEKTTFDILHDIYHEKFPEVEIICFVNSHLLTKAKNFYDAKVSNKTIREFFLRENKRYPNWIEKVDYQSQSLYRKLIYKAMYKSNPLMIKLVMFLRRILY